MEYGMKAAIIEDEKTHRDLLSSYIEAWGKKTKDPVFIKEYEMVAPDKKTLKKSVKSMFFMVQTRCEVETIKY